MARDASGVYTRPSNSFSNPVDGTAISSTHADALFDDMETAISDSAIKTPQYVVLTANASLPNERVLTAGSLVTITDAGAGSTVTVAVTDNELNALAAANPAADTFLYFTSTATATAASITSAGRSMVSAASAAAQTALLSAMVGDSGSGGTKGLVPAPAAGDATKFLKGNGTFATVAAAVTTGTVGTRNPYATAVTTAWAHGLGAAPSLLAVRLTCLTAEHGYSVGHVLALPLGEYITVRVDATNVTAVFSTTLPTVANTGTGVLAAITAANWRIDITPYLVS